MMMDYSSDIRIGFAEDIWMVGIIDEIRMPLKENDHNPILIDTKTRTRDTLPAEPQRRNGRFDYSSTILFHSLGCEIASHCIGLNLYDVLNFGRLQLMCYKYLWDNLVTDNFPSNIFFTYFGLNPQRDLCEDIKVTSADSGFSASVSASLECVWRGGSVLFKEDDYIINFFPLSL